MDTVHERLRESANMIEAVGDDVSTEDTFDEMEGRDMYTNNCWKIAQMLRELAIIAEIFEEE